MLNGTVTREIQLIEDQGTHYYGRTQLEFGMSWANFIWMNRLYTLVVDIDGQWVQVSFKL